MMFRIFADDLSFRIQSRWLLWSRYQENCNRRMGMGLGFSLRCPKVEYFLYLRVIMIKMTMRLLEISVS